MKERNFLTSACRFCRSYRPEGRRGGDCKRLGVPVQGSWEACAFAAPPFGTTLEKLEDIFQHSTSMDSMNSESIGSLASNENKLSLDNSSQKRFATKQDQIA